MSRKLGIAATVLGLMVLAVSLSIAPASSASTSKAHQYRIVKHLKKADVVRVAHHRVPVRHRAKYVKIHGIRRYLVVKHTRRFVALRLIRAGSSTVMLSGTVLSISDPCSALSASASTPAAAANDGQSATRWTASSRSFPQWWLVDLGSATQISGVKSAWAGRGAHRYRIAVSSDGTSFSTVADRTNNSARGSTSDAFTATGRFIRVMVTGNSRSASASSSEFTVYGDASDTPTATVTPTPTPSATVTPTPLPIPTPTATVSPSAAQVLSTLSAAKARTLVVVPAGTYTASSIPIPDGVWVQGAGSQASWLKGKVTYGSQSVIRDMKLGDLNYSTSNRLDASTTLFERCHFRGGGDNTYVLVLGNMDRSCDHITFKDCDVECNLGTANADHSNDVNNIRITENAAPGGAHVDSVTFDGCHVGVSNGVRSGSPRAGIEAYTWDSTGTVTHGWSNLKILNCVFEATDEFAIDLADCNRVSTVHSGPALISGNLIKGGGAASNARWGYCICVERPNGVVIENNTIYRASNNCIGTATGHLDAADGPLIIRNNLFDMTYNNGITSSAPYFYLRGAGVQFTGNTVKATTGTLFEIENALNPTVTNNLFHTGTVKQFLIGGNVTNLVKSPNTTD